MPDIVSHIDAGRTSLLERGPPPCAPSARFLHLTTFDAAGDGEPTWEQSWWRTPQRRCRPCPRVRRPRRCPKPSFTRRAGAVRFWVVTVAGDMVGAIARKEALRYYFRPSVDGADLLQLYRDHRPDIDAAVLRRVAAGTREPVMLREVDFEPLRVAPTPRPGTSSVKHRRTRLCGPRDLSQATIGRTHRAVRTIVACGRDLFSAPLITSGLRLAHLGADGPLNARRARSTQDAKRRALQAPWLQWWHPHP